MMTLFSENNLFIIRSFVLSDIDDFCLVVMDAQCMKYCPTGKLTRHQAESLFKIINKQEVGERSRLLAIEDKTSDHVVGFVGLQECCAEDELGLSFVFRLLPDFFNSPSVVLLFEQLIHNMFSIYQLNSMQAIVAKNNHATISIMESLHFKQVKKVDCRGRESFLYQYP
ncbi:GNAT family N-acetyltransferase [Psychromonas hadalis]|uniref:GNAT family N-acetyltransferase n=1 Tax=Psychromonas hadalis TaxID=211669 RepID=UPI0003B5A2F5|nr:GNAT family N-acetyltransferase [Psychromonas hadalis]